MKSLLILMLLTAQLCIGQWKPSFVHNTPPDVGSLHAVHRLVTDDGLPSHLTPMFDEQGPAETKSVATAVLYSLLLPGMGELYVGNYSTGKYFTIAEGVLWVTLGSVHWYATWLQNDARSFAIQNAHIGTPRDDDQYYIDLGNFISSAAYDEQAGRDRQYFKIYGTTSPYRWQWDSPELREQYRQLRVSSDEMFNNTRFVAAAIGVNHVISAINAARVAISHNKNVDEVGMIDIHADVIGGLAQPSGIVISFTKHF